MSSTVRKIARTQQVARQKAAKKVMRQMEHAVNSMPRQCNSCDLSFDPKEPNAIHTWRVSVSQTGTVLTCPKCWESKMNIAQSKDKIGETVV